MHDKQPHGQILQVVYWKENEKALVPPKRRAFICCAKLLCKSEVKLNRVYASRKLEIIKKTGDQYKFLDRNQRAISYTQFATSSPTRKI